MKTKTLHQSMLLQTTPHNVFEAFMDSKKHSEFTGAAATISKKIGGKFSVFDGWATGETKELITDKKIVQTWRADDWPDDHYSEITIALKEVTHGTRLDFTQTDIPEESYEEIAQGWIEWYWEKLKTYLSA